MFYIFFLFKKKIIVVFWFIGISSNLSLTIYRDTTHVPKKKFKVNKVNKKSNAKNILQLQPEIFLELAVRDLDFNETVRNVYEMENFHSGRVSCFSIVRFHTKKKNLIRFREFIFILFSSSFSFRLQLGAHYFIRFQFITDNFRKNSKKLINYSDFNFILNSFAHGCACSSCCLSPKQI